MIQFSNFPPTRQFVNETLTKNDKLGCLYFPLLSSSSYWLNSLFKNNEMKNQILLFKIPLHVLEKVHTRFLPVTSFIHPAPDKNI